MICSPIHDMLFAEAHMRAATALQRPFAAATIRLKPASTESMLHAFRIEEGDVVVGVVTEHKRSYEELQRALRQANLEVHPLVQPLYQTPAVYTPDRPPPCSPLCHADGVLLCQWNRSASSTGRMHRCRGGHPRQRRSNGRP